jgi:hypothetical protein
MREWERQQQADRRAVVEAARAKVEELDLLFSGWRRQQHAEPRIVYKTNENALIRPPDRLRYRISCR